MAEKFYKCEKSPKIEFIEIKNHTSYLAAQNAVAFRLLQPDTSLIPKPDMFRSHFVAPRIFRLFSQTTKAKSGTIVNCDIAVVYSPNGIDVALYSKTSHFIMPYFVIFTTPFAFYMLNSVNIDAPSYAPSF